MELESLNLLEYCVLESIGRSRYAGISTIGPDGLTKIYSLAPKQLHYVLVILEQHELISKQCISSDKKRSLIHLSRYAFKMQTTLENVCAYLLKITDSGNSSSSSKPPHSDSFANIKRNVGLTNKQFKNLVQNAEKQLLLRRFFMPVTCKMKKNKSLKKISDKQQQRQIRMVKLTDEYLASKERRAGINNTEIISDEIDAETSCGEANDENGPIENSLVELLGSEQSDQVPLLVQVFRQIERYGSEGVSLRQLGAMFGLDFYKSRRLGSNLQTHPEIAVLVRETVHGKAKYQIVALRKFFDQKSIMQQSTVAHTSSKPQQEDTVDVSQHESNEAISIQTSQATRQPTKEKIQAIMSQRAISREQLIMSYIKKHRICTKYELTKEIRQMEASMCYKGTIDSKTTKRMLIQLENDKKIRVFEVSLKNVSYMCARAYDINEKDDEFIKYCSTFKRTFDSVDVKVKHEENDEEIASETATTNNQRKVEIQQKKPQQKKQKASETKDNDSQENQQNFKLTRAFINSTVEKLKRSTNNSKYYGLLPKFQKAIILHRLLHYILFFHHDLNESELNDYESSIAQRATMPLRSYEEFENMSNMNETDKKILDSCILPPHVSTCIGQKKRLEWFSLIPNLRKGHEKSLTSSSDSLENNCIFIGEIFSHMPLSIFSSLIVINHEVPGLSALLKHPLKRHILVKDLPPTIIAPLIYERRYLQRILFVLQLLACLGLVSFVESPCKTNQSANRDVQSQLIYVHRQAYFYDTSKNECPNWNDLCALNGYNFGNKQSSSIAKKQQKYDKFIFAFNKSSDLVDYWHKLLYVSMNTYKFNSKKYLHENKKQRQTLLGQVTRKIKLEDAQPVWPMEDYGDHMGPGGYHSQLFLNSFKNWILPSNVASIGSDSIEIKTQSPQTDKSKFKNSTSNNTNSIKIEAPAITKQEDPKYAPICELALNFPFTMYRGISSTDNTLGKRVKSDYESSEDEASESSSNYRSDESDGEEGKNKSNASKKRRSIKPITRANKKFKASDTFTTHENKSNEIKTQMKKVNSLKLKKAKYLVDKAKVYRMQVNNNEHETSKANQQASSNSTRFADTRAIWHPEEDELILLVKVASLYFLPNERTVPFKLLTDIMKELIPHRCLDKKRSSFGRRIKMLHKSSMNIHFVYNKLELCRQDKEIERKYAFAKSKMHRSFGDREQIDLYKQFINDLRQKFMSRPTIGFGRSLSNNELLKARKPNAPIIQSTDDNACKLELPSSMEEFKERFTIKNIQRDLLKSKSQYFQQPTTDYEIIYNTLHSAIHVTCLIFILYFFSH
jgi:hypothetical protein